MTIMDANRKQKANHSDPAIITDHAYIPRAEWWSLCEICGLAEAAHAETTMIGDEHLNDRKPIHYYADDNPDVFEGG